MHEAIALPGNSQTILTIGRHGPVTVDQPKAMALEIPAQAGKGIDPREDQAMREAEPVMTNLGKRFLEDYVPIHWKPRTQEE